MEQERRQYQPIDYSYPGLREVHRSPFLYVVDDFLEPELCEQLINYASTNLVPAPVVGKGTGEVSLARTSSTCYLSRQDLPTIVTRISQLLNGKPIEHLELPQVGRYEKTQQYLAHYDAFDLHTEDGKRFAENGGQRVCTVLIYLNDVAKGGHTYFSNINMEFQPKRGTALVFFPASLDGVLDTRALHAALPAEDQKWVSQIWVRQDEYNGVASLSLPHPL